MAMTEDGLHFHVFSHAQDRRPSEIVRQVAELGAGRGVEFVGQFVGSFQVYAHLRVSDVSDAQQLVDDLWPQGLRTETSFEVKISAISAPKRRSPAFCALVRVRPADDPFVVLDRLDEYFGPLFDEETFWFGAAVVSGRYDLLVDLGRPSMDELVTTVREDLRAVPGIGRTDTSWADLRKNSIRP